MNLTARETWILHALATGMTNAEIGTELHLATETIKDNMTDLRDKLGARNRTHLVALAYHHGHLLVAST